MGPSEEVTALPELPIWWLLHVDMDSFWRRLRFAGDRSCVADR
jgi:hypothetical protein